MRYATKLPKALPTRAERAQRHLQRKRQQAQWNKDRDSDFELYRNYQEIEKTRREHAKQERANRKENWATGLLAPRRDVGTKADYYGTFTPYHSYLPKLAKRKHLDWSPIAEGDRVAIMRGRDKGRIATVDAVDLEANTVSLYQANLVDVQVPKWMREESDIAEELYTRPMPMYLEDVRLVYPLPDASDKGKPRDVVIERLEKVERAGQKKAMRCVAGTGLVIPWPMEVEDTEVEHGADTPEEHVLSETFEPLLDSAPMELSAVDELRNKYSNLSIRDRDGAIFVPESAAERREKGREKQRRLGAAVRTPLQELAEMRARQREAERRALTDAQLAKIGEIIELERSGQLGSSGKGEQKEALVQMDP